MSLTQHLKNKNSPVCQFLRSTFPNTKPFLAEARRQVRGARTLRPKVSVAKVSVPWDTIGMALDYRVRYYFDLTPNEQLFAYQGAHFLSQQINQAVASETLTYARTHDSILFFGRGTGNEVAPFCPPTTG